jgi:ATP-dependent RNA helicase DDX18/HAS1
MFLVSGFHLSVTGFERELRSILKQLPEKRQTMLFSATATKRTEDIVRLSMKRNAAFISTESDAGPTAAKLVQGYITCPQAERFLLLYTFLRRNAKRKVVVFFSSCSSVKYHAELLNYIDVPVIALHGRQKQHKRTAIFYEFCKARSGTLLTTDVAARGLDIPAVDWIIQFDPAADSTGYIHRVGRTCRASADGRALLILTERETAPALAQLRKAGIEMAEFGFPKSQIPDVQPQLERVVASNYYIQKSAKEAYKSYLRAYASQPDKDVFDVASLDLPAVARSFGLTELPQVDLFISGRDRAHSGAGRQG